MQFHFYQASLFQLFMQTKQKTIHYLEDIQFPHDPAAFWVFMFHGFGADASDLKSLADVLTPDDMKMNWVFPDGVQSVPIGPMMSGKAWWPLQLAQLPSDWSHYSPPEIETLMPRIWKMIEAFKIPWNRIILGGFSQGAMLATEIYLTAPETPAGLICFSGSLIRQKEWTTALAQRKNQKVFLSHGELDTVLPSSGTHKLMQLFKNHELQCEFSSFRGGHEIPMNAIAKAKNYIHSLR